MKNTRLQITDIMGLQKEFLEIKNVNRARKHLNWTYVGKRSTNSHPAEIFTAREVLKKAEGRLRAYALSDIRKHSSLLAHQGEIRIQTRAVADI